MQNEKKKINTKINGIPERIAFHIEIDKTDKGMSVIINGAESIIDYTENKVTLKIGKGNMIIDGVGLTLALYENKTIEIIGKIGEIRF